jgi:hypothetical protein
MLARSPKKRQSEFTARSLGSAMENRSAILPPERCENCGF